MIIDRELLSKLKKTPPEAVALIPQEPVPLKRPSIDFFPAKKLKEQKKSEDQGWIVAPERNKIYCALCGKERLRRLDRPTMNWLNYAQLALVVLPVAALMSLWFSFWGSAALMGFLFLIIFDVAKRSLYRHFASCPHCGFDPLLYKKNRKQAKLKIQEHLQQRKSETLPR